MGWQWQTQVRLVSNYQFHHFALKISLEKVYILHRILVAKTYTPKAIMDHSELGEPHNGFRFKFLEPLEYEQALKFMEDHLYNSLSPVGYDKKFVEDSNNLFRAMMENGSNLSYIAIHIESGEVRKDKLLSHINCNFD